MTRYLPLLLCLGCQPVEGPAGPQGPPGERGEQGPEGKPGKDAVGKRLHLIVADTGEDLGLLIHPLGVAYNEKAGVVVYYSAQPSLYYADPDCRGAVRMGDIGSASQGIAALGPRGTILRAKGPKMPFQYRSILNPDGPKCTNGDGTFQYTRDFDDTGVPAQRHAESEFAIELR